MKRTRGNDDESSATSSGSRLVAGLPAPVPPGRRAYSAVRGARTAGDNYQSFVKRVMKNTPTGYAWPSSPEFMAFLAAFEQNKEDSRLVFYWPCPIKDEWQQGPARLDLPPNLFGLRFCSSFRSRTASDPRCLSDHKEEEGLVKCGCGVTSRPNTKAIMNSVGASMFAPRKQEWIFVEPPPNVQVIRPGYGVLIDIPAHAGNVSVVFSGACYFLKTPSNGKKKKYSEHRLPKDHMATYIELPADGKLQAYGVQMSETSPFLVQLLTAQRMTIVLFVSSPECHPWAEEDHEKCFSSRPGYIYNITSTKNLHRVEPIRASDLGDIMADVNVFLKSIDDKRNAPKEEEKSESSSEVSENSVEDEPMFAEVPEVDQEVDDNVPPPNRVKDILTVDHFPGLGSLDDIEDRGATYFHRPSLPVSEKSLPGFYLKVSETKLVLGESTYDVVTTSDQFVEVRVSFGEPGLIVSTTSTYFCRVRRSSQKSFVLETVRQTVTALDSLSNAYFLHNFLSMDEPPLLTHSVLTQIAT